MHEMMAIGLQELNEKRFCRKHIDPKIREWFAQDESIIAAINKGVELFNEYRYKTYSYQSKNDRVAALQDVDAYSLVSDVFVGIAYYTGPELFTGVTAQLAGRLNWDDKPAAITTMAEIVAVLCFTDAYEIYKHNKFDSLRVQSNFALPDDIMALVEGGQYLPPMVVKPKELVNNATSGYLTFNDQVLLGKNNYHDGNLCLESLNEANSVELSLNLEFLSKIEELPSDVTVQDMLDAAMARGNFITQTQAEERVRKHYDNWDKFKKNSYEFYYLMQSQGNRFYMTHKVDERGRMYAQGYHISPQGNAFKKAVIDYADKEIIDVPSDW